MVRNLPVLGRLLGSNGDGEDEVLSFLLTSSKDSKGDVTLDCLNIPM